VLNQTYQNIEIICVDNNSTDNTLLILKEYEKKFPNKIKILQEFKKGAPAARNKGLYAANGEWIQFLDADDLLLPKKINHQIELIKSQITCPDIVIGALIKQYSNNERKSFELLSNNVWEALIRGKSGCTCSNLYKRSIVIEIGGWDEKKRSSQESYLLFELLKRNVNVLFDNKEYTIIRVRLSGSITHSNKADNWERFIILREEIWGFLKSVNLLTTEIEIALKQIIFDYIRFSFKDDRQKAIFLYKKYIKGDFKPIPSISTTKRYLIVFRLFGFIITETLLNILNKRHKK
jgi:glycosyltransferase involved in cell wall biosynthesis